MIKHIYEAGECVCTYLQTAVGVSVMALVRCLVSRGCCRRRQDEYLTNESTKTTSLYTVNWFPINFNSQNSMTLFFSTKTFFCFFSVLENFSTSQCEKRMTIHVLKSQFQQHSVAMAWKVLVCRINPLVNRKSVSVHQTHIC